MRNIEWYLHAMPNIVKHNGTRFYLTLQCQEYGYKATYESVSNRGESHILVIDPFGIHATAVSFVFDPCRALEGLYKFFDRHKDQLEVIYPDPLRWRDKEEVPMYNDATIIVALDGCRPPEEVKLSDIRRDYDTWGEYVEAYGVREWRYKEDPLDTQEDEQETV